MNEHIPDLNIERIKVEGGEDQLMLEQDCDGNIGRVCLHPIQLRFMAEQMGLVESSDLQAQRTIDSLRHKLSTLRHRIDHLTDFLIEHADNSHADLSYEINFSVATSDIAEQFCRDEAQDTQGAA